MQSVFLHYTEKRVKLYFQNNTREVSVRVGKCIKALFVDNIFDRFDIQHSFLSQWNIVFLPISSGQQCYCYGLSYQLQPESAALSRTCIA